MESQASYDDLYPIENDFDYGEQFEEYIDPISYEHLIYFCILPTLKQLAETIYPVVLVSILLRLLAFRNVSLKHMNTINSLLSILALIYLYKIQSVLYLSLFTLKIYVLLNIFKLSKTNLCVTIMVCSLVHMFIGRVILFEVSEWNSIKGMEMILIMKTVSLVVDLKHSKWFNLTDLFSYLLSLNTTMFGPWITYNDHLNLLKKQSINIRNLIFNTTISVLCLISSNCVFNLIEVYVTKNFLLGIYFEALSFRLSHYFVSYLSQAICSLNGSSRNIVTHPMYIELPRSLLDVVTNWNYAMHYWLKTYVFRPIKQWRPESNFIAVFITYFVSSMLHTFDENITMILFSLGFYTYVEFGLRSNLSKLFNSCIKARRCYVCSHKYKNKHWLTRIINLAFLVLNVYHLAYLGQIFFHANNTENFNESKWFHLIQAKWSLTSYSSHFIAFICFLIYKLTDLIL